MAIDLPAPIIAPAPLLVGPDAKRPPVPLPQTMPAVAPRRVLYWLRQCRGGVCVLVPVYGE